VSVFYADDAVTVHHGDCLDVLRAMPDASVDAVCTDPPYGLADHHPRVIAAALSAWLAGDREHVPDGKGFMGRDWDRFVPPPAVWDECWRVLKPGGHLLAFAAPRTADLMGMSIRLAGFEIRDSIKWIYASGFPKGQDVGKAVDRMRDDRADVLRVTAWLNSARLAAGVTHKQIDAAFGFNGMASHWTSVQGKAAIVPTWEQWVRLQGLLGFGTDMNDEVRRLNERKGSVGESWASREVVGVGHRVRRESTVQFAGLSDGEFPVTAAASEDARRWQGWNTNLKPAHEPIVVARKSTGFNSTVANVLEHGTGALNVGACRVGGEERTNPAGGASSLQRVSRVEQGYRDTITASVGEASTVTGRWPSNVVMSHAPDCTDVCLPGCPVAELDHQSGTSTSRTAAPRTGRQGDGWRMKATGAEYDDQGGASRFFPVFRFESKAGSAERPRVDGVAHSTVKPLSLMRWLVRLVTPPGGVVLEPFAGSGTTAEACVLEGFRCIAVERDATYLPLITARLSKPLQPSLDLFGGAA
jgi:DNA modification methylase